MTKHSLIHETREVFRFSYFEEGPSFKKAGEWERIVSLANKTVGPFIQFSGSFMDEQWKMILDYPGVQKESEVLHLVVSYV